MMYMDEIRSILNDCDTKKVIATANENGILHVTFKEFIFVAEDNLLVLLELLDRSITNQNLVYSIWFDKTVAINVLSKNGNSYLIQAIPQRALVSGREFEKYYKFVQQKYNDIDLSTVWKLKILEISEKTLSKQIEKHKTEFPIIDHLDRLVT